MTRSHREKGRVTLVGAGPGDPELLTLKAVRALEDCDIVFYDALVPREVVALARGLAVSVGKRAGAKALTQDGIHRLMIRAAESGRRVVRLKCGDPYVFGRGGEEVLALRAAGIRVDVVPGVSSAIAAASFAGVPVTHRGLASGFIVMTAQPDAVWRDTLARLSPGAPLTLVFLMGIGARGAIAVALAERGWDPHTPAMIVLGATHRRSWTWTGTIAEIGALVIPDAVADLPGTIVVGEVVSLAPDQDAVAAATMGRAAAGGAA